MNTAVAGNERDNVVNLQERRLDRTVLRTYRTKTDIDNIVPNDKQPRQGPKVDEELQRQIEANGGLFEPLLVEPHPDIPGKFRIIDGDRRWTNSRELVEQGKCFSSVDIYCVAEFFPCALPASFNVFLSSGFNII